MEHTPGIPLGYICGNIIMFQFSTKRKGGSTSDFGLLSICNINGSGHSTYPQKRGKLWCQCPSVCETVHRQTQQMTELLYKQSRRSKKATPNQAMIGEVELEQWQFEEIEAGVAELDDNDMVPHEAVVKWMRSWGKPGELKAPR